jgi:ABC-type dipeptide/oligopeptide/nickel transport system permease subunit
MVHAIPAVILSEATLAFLGLIPRGTSTLGNVIQLAIESRVEDNI